MRIRSYVFLAAALATAAWGNGSPATLHRVLGGDSVWAQPPTAAIEVDGQLAAASGDPTLAPGSHEIVISYAYDGGALRAAFRFIAAAGIRYQVMFQALPKDRLSLWIANADTGGAVTSAIERTWIPGADLPLLSVARYPLPEARFGCSAVADARAIYLVGGKRWDNLYGALGTMGGRIVLVGEILRFDLKTHQTTTLTRAIGRREFQAAVLVDGKIYILGPEDSLSSRSHSLAIYDLSTRKLSYGPAIPRVVSGFGTAILNRQLYVVGGWSPDPKIRNSEIHPATSVVDYFDLDQHSWSRAAPLPLGAEGKAVSLAGGIVFAGGLMGRGTVSDEQSTVFVLNKTLPRVGWQVGAAGPNRSNGGELSTTEAASARLDHDTEIQTVQFLNGGTGAWTFLPPLPTALPIRAAVVLDNRLFLFDDRDDSVQVYDPRTGRASIFHLRVSVPGSTAVVVGDQVFLIGSANSREGSITAFKLNPNWSQSAPEAQPLHGS